MKKLAVIILAVATSFSGIGPSFAENSGDEHSVQSRGTFGDSGSSNNRFSNRCSVYPCNGYRHSYNNRYYGNYNNRYYRNRYDRGYYRNDNGAGALIGGLAAGAIIGSIIASQPRAYAYRDPHVNWCYSRYRTYRASDNTFQPNYGPRRQCVSRY
ncbi:BA14K family protein [Rhizobium sp. Root1220]|uniref:BA14K family protein n=1 Tax=Rhizobium sp. Root1220 TaxID=1736432 RepID=UPI0006F1E07B|nr:BA14K family protein [Rhizobium sp. Root1220]KQV83611.1 hypothetical protein ASC90_20200 [Rhizobium sp. Root1220]